MRKNIRIKEIIFGLFVIAAVGVILLPLFLSEQEAPKMSLAPLPPVPTHELAYSETEDKS